MLSFNRRKLTRCVTVSPPSTAVIRTRPGASPLPTKTPARSRPSSTSRPPASTPAAPGTPPEIAILTEFKRVQPPISAPQHQPPGNNTLVNFPTIFYSNATPQDIPLTVLSQPVQLRITPTTYTWDYGDHTDPVTTSDPGHPYPHQTVTHNYTTLATYTAAVTITFTGQFSVNGGTYQPITGTITRTSPGTTLTTLQARAELAPNPDNH